MNSTSPVTSRRLAIAFLLALACSCSSELGEEFSLQDETRDRAIKYHVFLPGKTGKSPLVLFSHGSGGDFRSYGWLFRALIDGGYAVAALNHPGNSAGDNSDEGVVRVWDRPQDLSRILDDIQSQPALAASIDVGQTGAVGHSSGGYTALALAGGVFIPENMQTYCEGSDRGPDCDMAVDAVNVDYTGATESYRDDRVRAVVALAPAVGPAIESNSLASIDIPVLVVAAVDDEILPHARHAEYYAAHIPDAELWELPVGGHFLFMECNPITYVVDWFIEEFALCAEPEGSSRAQLQGELAPGVVAFLDNELGTQ